MIERLSPLVFTSRWFRQHFFRRRMKPYAVRSSDDERDKEELEIVTQAPPTIRPAPSVQVGMLLHVFFYAYLQWET